MPESGRRRVTQPSGRLDVCTVFGRWPRLLQGLGSALLLGACSTVTIHAGDGAATVERRFGVVVVEVTPASTPVVTEMTTLGLASSPAGTTLGWSKAQLAALPEGCRVVFWVQRREDLQAFKQLTAGQPGLCATDFTRQETSR
jgi:hypothetical protein